MVKKNFKDERRLVSRLIYMVLAETLSARNAILKFPKDVNDSSIQAAYHAIVHREADENFRVQDFNYKEEQDDYLEFIAQTLQDGNSLPQNIIKSYNIYYKNDSISLPDSKKMKGFLKSICRFLNV